MFDRDSRSVLRSLMGLFNFRSNPVSKVYQQRPRNEGILEVTWSSGNLRKNVKDTAVGELTPDPFPQLANGTGPNRTRAQWKFTDALVNKYFPFVAIRCSLTFFLLIFRTSFLLGRCVNYHNGMVCVKVFVFTRLQN